MYADLGYFLIVGPTSLFVVVVAAAVQFCIQQSSELNSDLLVSPVLCTMVSHICLFQVSMVALREKGINYSPLYNNRYPMVALGLLFVCMNMFLIGNIIEMKEINLGNILLAILCITIILGTIFLGYYTKAWSTVSNIFTEPVAPSNVFLGDQMCSQVPALRKILYIFCYYCTGSYKEHDYGFYKTNTVYKDLSYVISCVPFLYRKFQCVRKCYDERQTSHLINFGKYFCAMLEALARVAYENDKTSKKFLYSLVVISVTATFYQLYWDFARDWDILQFKPQIRWLRSMLLLPKFYYYLAVGLNFVLRFGWAFEFIPSISKLNDESIKLIVALVEVFRRVMWNFFRLENEEVMKRNKNVSCTTVSCTENNRMRGLPSSRAGYRGNDEVFMWSFIWRFLRF